MALSENRLPQSVSSGEKSIISAKIIQNSHFYGVKNPPDSGAHPKQTFFSQWKPVWKTGPLMFSPLEQWFWTTTASWLSFRLLFFFGTIQYTPWIITGWSCLTCWACQAWVAILLVTTFGEIIFKGVLAPTMPTLCYHVGLPGIFQRNWGCWTLETWKRCCTLWLFHIAVENDPFIDGLPIRNGDFPWLC